MPRLHLGFYLTPLDREGEAIAHLGVAHALAQKLDEKAREIEVLLHLGTAVQYAGDRKQAMALFAEGLNRADAYAIDEQVHFLLYYVVVARRNWGGLAMRDDPLPPLWQSGRRSVRRLLSSRHARR